MTYNRLGTLLFCLFVSIVAHAAGSRTWTSTTGSKVTAELIWQNSTDVSLRVEGGRRITCKKHTLSAADLEYLDSELTTRPDVFDGSDGPDYKWITNYDEALVEAKKYNRPILYLSTNTHSCGYCIVLEEKVLSDSTFERFAKKSVILYKVDYAASYRDGKNAEERRLIYNKIHSEAAVPQFIKVSGWPHIAIITPDEEVLHSDAERAIQDPRDFVRKYSKIIEESVAVAVE